jgi:hypothetical protein
VVGSNEPEYYPLEIITTIAVILSIILSFLIFYENKERNLETYNLYLLLLIFFIAYYLAENNWLYGRESAVGTITYAFFAGAVFLFTMMKTYNINKPIFLIFSCGVIFLAVGTIIDAIIDGYIPLTFNMRNRILFEEIPEAYASLFFLHSMLLFYFYLTQEKSSFVLDKVGTLIIVFSSIIIGYGNSYFLLEHGNPLDINRMVVGIILYLFGLLLIIGYFMYFHVNDQTRYWRDIDK